MRGRPAAGLGGHARDFIKANRAASIRARPVTGEVPGRVASSAAFLKFWMAAGGADSMRVARHQCRNIRPASSSARNIGKEIGTAMEIQALGPAARKTKPRDGARTPSVSCANGTPFSQVGL